MTRAQQTLHKWAYSNARNTLARVRTVQDPETRSATMASILDTIKPGLANTVNQRTVVFHRLGHPFDAALEHALAEQLMKMGAEKLNAAEGLGTDADAGTGRDPTTWGSTATDWVGPAESSGSTRSRTGVSSGMLDSITGLISGVTQAGVRIGNMIVENVRARREQRQEIRERQAASVREDLAAETRAVEARRAEEREERERAEQREIERIRAERGELGPVGAPRGGVSFVPVVLGVVAVGAVGAGAYYGYKHFTKDKRAG